MGQRLPVHGVFPRRVIIGEPLFKNGANQILSPINGIAILEPNEDGVSLRIDGHLHFKPNYQRKEFSKNEIKEKITELGIVSFDFPGQLISYYLDSFSGSEDSTIVLAPICSENQIDFKSILLNQYKPELEILKKNLETLFPKSRVMDFLIEKKVNYKYPDGFYKLFLKKYCNIHVNSYDHNKILFLGPESIFYLVQALYYGIPFHERNVSINIINSSGKLDGQPRYFRIKNGTDLSDFFSTFKEKYNYKYFTINSIYTMNPIFNISDKFIFDIYQHHTFYLSISQIEKSSESMCIDCGDCDYYCPVDAKPRSLLLKNSKEFNNENCIECGLCTIFCPSKIDFQTRIKENMGEKIAFT